MAANIRLHARRRPALGDIVTMPLPTEWAPEIMGSGGGVPFRFVLGAPPGVYAPGPAQSGPAPGPAGLPAYGGSPGYTGPAGQTPAGPAYPGGAGQPGEYYGAGFPPSGAIAPGPAGGPDGVHAALPPGARLYRGPGGAVRVLLPDGSTFAYPGPLPASAGWVPGGAHEAPSAWNLRYPGAGYPDAYDGFPAGGVPSGSLTPGGVAPGAPGTPGATPGAFIPGGLQPGMTVNGLVIPHTVSSRPRPGSPPVTGWTPNLIYPDWMLPPALDRSNPLQRKNVWIPNQWDYRLRYECLLWQWMAQHGGLRSCCRIPDLGAPIWDQPPWEVMPSQGVEYRKMFSLPIASVSGGGPFTGVDTILGRFNIPNGYDAVLNQFVCKFTGTGFDEFSGEIVWRVRVDNRFAKDLGNVTNTFGSYEAAFLVPGYGIRLVSGQTVYLIANIPVGSPVAGGVVSAAAFGWWYPRR